MALFKESKEKQLQKLREWIISQHMGSPAWQVASHHSEWLCPFCGKAAFTFSLEKDLIDKMVTHLDTQCAPFMAGQRMVVFSDSQLRDKVRFQQFREMVVSNLSFQLRDAQRYWFCPYCAKATEVVISADGKINSEILEAMFRHVDYCYGYGHGKGTPRPAEQIKKVIADGQRQTRLTEVVKNKVASSPVWRVKNRKGFWVCPYCKKIVNSIDVSSNISLLQSAPAMMASHLLDSCAAHAANAEPAATAEELERIVAELEPPPESPAKTPTNIPADLIRSLTDEIEAVKASVAVDKDLQKSLQDARKKQLHMLPKLPKVPGYDIEALYKPCVQVGGDMYDFISLSESELGVLIGDVSGHGVDAALIMTMVKKVFDIHGKSAANPKDAMIAVQREISHDLDKMTFVTAIYGVLDTRTHVFKFVRAGHTPLVLYNPARDPCVRSFEPNGIVLSAVTGRKFATITVQDSVEMQPGDVLVLYTDGLAECANRQHEELGTEGVMELTKKFGGHEARYLLHMLDLSALEFRQGGPQEDDITIICIKRT